jgi:hypothetical protein
MGSSSQELDNVFEQSNAGTFVSEAVGVALAVALQQSRGLSFCAVIRDN